MNVCVLQLYIYSCLYGAYVLRYLMCPHRMRECGPLDNWTRLSVHAQQLYYNSTPQIYSGTDQAAPRAVGESANLGGTDLLNTNGSTVWYSNEMLDTHIRMVVTRSTN